VSNNLRNGETAYRYGGEEFTILFTKVSDSQAVQAIERVRKIISKEIFEQNIAITFSAGVYESQPGEDQKSCIAKADEGLYEAKRTGRNKTIVYDKTSLKKEAS
jgi:diguanylate cyclase (GGDEF)-like protein